MSIYKDRLLVVDLEATCWDGYDAPEGQTNEIIEIGVTVMELKTLAMTPPRSLLVRPTQSEISPFCTQLTSLTPALVEADGMSFEAACHLLETEFDSRNRLWCSWGSWDMKIMRAQCKAREVRYPFSDKHANLKRVYSDAQGNRVGLKAALEALSLPPEGVQHRGGDDAYNAGRVLAALLQAQTGNLRKYGL